MASGTSTNTSKSVEAMTKHIQKRSLDVKFDLEGTKYNPIENIGIGAYGVVCSAIHKKSKDKVAIKKIPNVFDVLVIAKRTHREIKILKHFKHDNIISIREILKPKEEYTDFRDIYVVFDLMESDLHKIIYSDQELSEEHSRYFLYQILRGLKYIHSANVVHRDLKPGNILVNEDCHVRVGDFGMSRGIFASPNEPSHFMTQYVATRWYRAPEILLSLVEYGTAVDMWSVGCIFAEMLGRKHLFPGKDYISQIKLIIGVLGSPSAQVFTKCQNEVIKKILVTIGPKEAIPWKTLFPKASKKAVDLLSKMLVINPKDRITVVEALKHPYLQKYHDPDDEPTCVPAFNFDFEKEFLDKEKLRDVIYKEIMEFHKPRTPTLSFSAFIRPAPNKEIKSEGNMVRIPENSDIIKVEKSSPLTESNSKLPDIKTSPVSVNTNSLLSLSANDVEMLSAKSNDSRMDTQSCAPVETVVDKENKAQTDSKTISDDTKALIKKALLNSQWRQRHDSTGDKDEKPKVITAAMRQKERQDKRREKEKNKKLRNKKKEAKAQKEEVFLSEADKAMLKRWAEMKHKSEKPILPKPEGDGRIPTTTVTTIQQNDPPASDRTTPPQVVHVTPNHSPPDLLQGKSPNSSQNISVSQGASQSVGGGIFISNFNNSGSSAPQAVVLPDVFPTNSLNQSTSNPFLHPPQSTTSQSSIIQSASQSNYSDSAFNTSGQSDLSFTDSSFNTSGNQSTLSFESNTSFGSLNTEGMDLVSLSKDLQSSIKCTLPSSQASFTSPQGGFSYQSDQHGANYRHQMNVMNPEPQITNIQPTDLNYPAGRFDQNMVISSPSIPQQPSGFTQSTAFPPQQSYNQPVPSQPPGFHGTDAAQFPPDINNQTQHETIPDLLNFTPTSEYGGITPPKPFQHDSQSFYDQIQMNQKGSSNSNSQPQGASASGEPVWNTSSVTASSGYKAQSPGLKVDCSSPERKPSNQSNSQLQPDLIALLSKQMSKSLLDNIMPPSLSLTPRGTGAGYGVGMDMDALLVQAQATSDSGTQSPLSSSLLADWLDVTGGGILIADIQNLEQEMSTQSPLPFHDL